MSVFTAVTIDIGGEPFARTQIDLYICDRCYPGVAAKEIALNMSLLTLKTRLIHDVNVTAITQELAPGCQDPAPTPRYWIVIVPVGTIT